MASSYKTPDYIRYHSPIYIHSHRKKLDTNAAIDRLLIKHVQNDIDSAIDQLTKVINYLKNISIDPLVQQFYKDTHSGHTRNHSQKGQLWVDNYVIDRQKLVDLKKQQDVEKIVSTNAQKVEELYGPWLKSQADARKIIADVVGWQGVKYFTDFFRQEAILKGNKKKNLNLSGTSLVKDMITTRKGEITKECKRQLRKYRNSINPLAKDVETILNDIQSGIDSYINSFNDVNHCLLDANSAGRLQHTITAFNGHKIAKYGISGSGFSFEKIFNYLLLDKITKQNNGAFEISLNGETFIVEGTSSSNKGHEVTTDNVIKILDGVVEKIKIGFSLKATVGKTGATSKFSKTIYDSKIGKQGSTIIKKYFSSLYNIPLEDQNELLYYLGNEMAFSVFVAPYSYNWVINLTTNETQIPANNAAPVKLDRLVYLRSLIVAIFLLKAMIGSIFLQDDFIAAISEKNYIPPILISFLNEDYFTYEVLERILDIATNNSTQMGKYANVKMDDFGYHLSENKLTDLFLTKKMIESKYANRYDDLINNEVSYPFMDIAPYLSLDEALKDITGDIAFQPIIEKLTRPVNFHIAINELIK